MTGPALSIALCTYNGEAYLEAQLESIAAQSRAPDEMVVCDDRSTDRTVEILEAFAGKSAFPVRIHVNPSNVGSNRNFEKAIRLCGGQVIVLSDQDDVWLPEKLSRIADAFAADPEAGAVFSDAFVVDRDLNSLGVTIWDRFEFTKRRRKLFDEGRAFGALLVKNVVTGATLAFKREYLDRIAPIPPQWVHDYWIAIIVSLYAKLAYIDEPLIRYRQHFAQQIGAREKSPLTKEAVFGDNTASYASEFVRYSQLHRRVKKLRDTVPDYDGVMKAIRDKVIYCYLRSRLPRQRHKRVRAVAANLFSLRYHRYSFGLMSAVKDLVLPGRREGDA